MRERAECRQAVWQHKSISERQGKNAGRPLFPLSVSQSVVSRVCVCSAMFIAWFLVCSARLSFTLLIFSGDQQRSCEVNAFTFHCGSCRHVSGCILPTCQANYSQFKQCLSFHYVMSCWDQMRQVSPPDACCWREPSISCISFHVTDLRPSCESWR